MGTSDPSSPETRTALAKAREKKAAQIAKIEADDDFEGVTSTYETKRIWVKAEGDPNSPDYKPPRYVYKRIYPDGNFATLEQDEIDKLEKAKQSGGQYVSEDIRYLYEFEKPFERERQGQLKELVSEKEQAFGGETETTGTPFETTTPASYSDSFINVIGDISIDMDARDVLNVLRPQMRRNVGTIDTQAKKMDMYAKEKLLQQVREGAITRAQALNELDTMMLIAIEMEEQLLMEKDTPIVGKGYEAIDDSLVKIYALMINVNDAIDRIKALLPLLWNPATQGALGLIGQSYRAKGGIATPAPQGGF